MHQDRIKWIDVSKGIGLVAVIAGHLFSVGSYVSCIIFSFHMPLFFFLSGIFFRPEQNVCSFIKKKSKALLIPYLKYVFVGICFTLIIQIVQILSGGGTSLQARAILKDVYQGAPNSFYVGQLWFLISLFWVNVIAYFFTKYLKPIFYKIIVLLLFLLYVVIVSPHIRSLLPGQISPLMMDTSVMASVFFIIAFYSKEVILSFLKNVSYTKEAILCILTFVFMLFSSKNGWVNIAIPQFGNFGLYLAFSFLGIVTVILFSDLLMKTRFTRLQIFFSELGMNSMFVFAIHSLPIYIFCYIIKIVGIDSNAGVCTTSAIWSVVGTLLVSIFMLLLLRSRIATKIRE